MKYAVQAIKVLRNLVPAEAKATSWILRNLLILCAWLVIDFTHVYVINNFTVKINFAILLTCTQWRQAHVFQQLFKPAKEKAKQYKILILKPG